jgi:GNAT superfamily N-acetyltransferase
MQNFKHQQKELPFIIEPLTYLSLKEAENLRNRIFKNDLEDIEKDLLLASLDTTQYKNICEANDVRTISYWVAKDIKSDKVIGLTGIYTEDENESCWLGWFCIDEAYRGKEFGKRLLEFSIEQANNMGKKYLHVYTYKAKRFKTAITMYKQYGFVEYQEKRDGDSHAIYLKKQLITKRN